MRNIDYRETVMIRRPRFNSLFSIAVSVLVGLLAIALMQSASAVESQGEWTRFRGPNGSGLSNATTIPTKFSEKDYNWKIKVPGVGYGSPVIWGKKVFVVSANKKTAERHLVCLSATDGSITWTKSFASQPYRLHRYNNYGTTTPAVDKDHVYMYWVTEKTVSVAAIDHAGKEVWQRDLGPFKSSHGGGTSPILYKDMVILANDQVGKSFLVALDAKTGKDRWRIARKSVKNGTAYAVPCIFSPKGGKPQLIFTSRADGMIGVDPETGKPIWELSDLFDLRVVSSPVIASGLVFGTCGQGGGGTRFVAVRPGTPDSAGSAKVVYDKKKAIPYVTTPLAYGDLLFTINDGTGVATCFHAPSGDVKWQKRLDGSFFGSTVCVNGVIYTINKEGNVVIFKAADKFELLSIHSLGEKSYSTPAIAGGRMYLRTENHLVSIGGNR
jgi:outer membrane protein assembly factor BamB